MSKIIYVNLEEIISKIDLNRLSRDYQKYPLITKKTTSRNVIGDIPKKDIEYLYIELNLTANEITKFLNISNTTLKRILQKNHIHKDRKKASFRIKDTKSLIYNDPNYNNREKAKNTCIKKFGKPTYVETNEFKEKSKETCIKHFGVEFAAQSEIVKEKMKNTCINHYGTKYFVLSEECKIKIFHSKTRNNTHRSSKEEDKIFEILLTKFPNAIHHPIPSEKYPFQCDFYIPELDLYIEYQGDWTHGRNPYHKPFKASHKGHLEMVKLWISKETSYYNNVVKTWTFKDPLKRQTAWLNKLNWIEFFNMKQFMEWFNKQ